MSSRSFVGQQSQQLHLGSLFRVLPGWREGSIIWDPIRRLWGRTHLQTHSDCQQNLVPCGCITEVPISLLAFEQDSFLASIGFHILRLAAPLSPRSEGAHPVFLWLEPLWIHLLPTGRRKLCCRLRWLHQDNPRWDAYFKVAWLATLITSTEFL